MSKNLERFLVGVYIGLLIVAIVVRFLYPTQKRIELTLESRPADALLAVGVNYFEFTMTRSNGHYYEVLWSDKSLSYEFGK